MQRPEPLAVEHLGRRDLLPFRGSVQNFGQFLPCGISHQQLEEEPIELCFRQRIGSLLVDGILSGQNEERLGQRTHLPTGSDLALLHRLQHGRLGLRRGAVDFVGQDQMGKHRTPLELELAATIRRFHDQVGAQNVSGHQVGRELDPAEAQLEHFGQGPNQQRLAQTWNAFEQNVTAGENGGEGSVDDGVLADHDAANLGAKLSVGFPERGDLLFSGHGAILGRA